MPLAYQQQKERFRWLTDDRFSGDWYVADIRWCSFGRGTRWVVLSNNYRTAPTHQWDFITNENAYAFMFNANLWWLSGRSNLIVLGDRVFNTLDWSWFLSWTISFRNWLFVKSAWTNYGVLLWTWTSIYRWDDDASGVGTATTIAATLSGTSNFRPVLVDWWYLYVGWDGVVDAIEITSGTWTTTFSVSIPWQCRAITKIWDQIFLYSSDWLNWYKMSWDWVSAFPLYIQKWADNPIMNVANIDNFDYVITGNDWLLNQYRRLYLSTGYEKQLLSASDFIINNKQLFNYYPGKTNAIETYWNVIYIPWTNRIYTYWTNKWSLPSALGVDIYINEDVDEITALWIYNNTLYIWYTVWSQWKRTTQDLKVWYAYWTGGYVDTIAWDWWDIETEKNLNRLIINSYTPSWTSIELYAKIDNLKYRVFTATTPSLTSPTKWDTYTYWWLTYTVTEYIASKKQVICTRDWLWSAFDVLQWNSWTLTRTFWSWDASIPFTEVNNYIYIDTISWNDRKTNITYKKEFYDVHIRAVLTTDDEQKTPELYSIKALFDYKDLQNG